MKLLERCPRCDRPLDPPVDPTDPSVDLFCPNPECDQPLFWQPRALVDAGHGAAGAVGAAEHAPEHPRLDHTGRYPGLRGVESDTAVPCWNCLEFVDQRATQCWYCRVPIPRPDDRVEPGPAAVGPCSSPTGEVARRTLDVPAWLLVALGVVLLALLVVLGSVLWG